MWECLLGWKITRGVRRYMTWFMAYVSDAGRGFHLLHSASLRLPPFIQSHFSILPSLQSLPCLLLSLSPSINGLQDNYMPPRWRRNGGLWTGSGGGVGRISTFGASKPLYRFRCVRIARQQPLSAAASRGRFASLYASASIDLFILIACTGVDMLFIEYYFRYRYYVKLFLNLNF